MFWLIIVHAPTVYVGMTRRRIQTGWLVAAQMGHKPRIESGNADLGADFGSSVVGIMINDSAEVLLLRYK